jgi:N-glycosylase/DNA lyase
MYLMPPARYSDGVFSRVLRLNSGKPVYISVTSSGTVDNPDLSVSVEPRVSEEDEREVNEIVSFMFSVDHDLAEFYSIAKKDRILKYAREDMYGLEIQTTPTLFEGLVIGFCLQWVSFERGVKMMDCLIRRYGERVSDHYAFPTPEALANATLEELKECNLGFRAERIKWISEKAAEGLEFEGLKSLPDDQLRQELMKIKWVGEVTAEALLLWRFKRYSAFPLDVWSSKIIQAFYPELNDKTLDEMKRFAEDRWDGYKGLAYYYLLCDRRNLTQRLGVELGLRWN